MDEYEPNDSRATASQLANAQLATDGAHGVLCRDDSDWYRIAVRCGQAHVTANVTFAHSDGDVDARLHDAKGFVKTFSTSNTDNEMLMYTHASGSPTSLFLNVYGFNSPSHVTYLARVVVDCF